MGLIARAASKRYQAHGGRADAFASVVREDDG